jgi:hypothetical protein
MSLLLSGTDGVSDVDGTAATPAIRGTDANTGISFGTDTVTISTGGVARVTTDASGNVGIGVIPSSWDTLNALDVGSGGALWGTAAQVGVASNAYYGSSNFRYKATNVAAALQVDGNVFKFLTAPSGTAGDAISFTQAMTLDASGNLLVGTTSGGTYRLQVTPSGGNGALAIDASTTVLGTFWNRTTSGPFVTWYVNGASAVGSVSTNGSTTAYNTTSDYRLKENVAPMTGALATVAALKPCTYTWKANGSAGQGFIAHELQDVCPNAVSGEKDAVDKDGKPQYQGVDTSFLVATLVAAIQEQQALIQDLTTRLTTLEGN